MPAWGLAGAVASDISESGADVAALIRANKQSTAC
jgi:hypothetical protein